MYGKMKHFFDNTCPLRVYLIIFGAEVVTVLFSYNFDDLLYIQ